MALTPNGDLYKLSALLGWLDESSIDPVTRKPLSLDEVTTGELAWSVLRIRLNVEQAEQDIANHKQTINNMELYMEEINQRFRAMDERHEELLRTWGEEKRELLQTISDLSTEIALQRAETERFRNLLGESDLGQVIINLGENLHRIREESRVSNQQIATLENQNRELDTESREKDEQIERLRAQLLLANQRAEGLEELVRNPLWFKYRHELKKKIEELREKPEAERQDVKLEALVQAEDLLKVVKNQQDLEEWVVFVREKLNDPEVTTATGVSGALGFWSETAKVLEETLKNVTGSHTYKNGEGWRQGW